MWTTWRNDSPEPLGLQPSLRRGGARVTHVEAGSLDWGHPGTCHLDVRVWMKAVTSYLNLGTNQTQASLLIIRAQWDDTCGVPVMLGPSVTKLYFH